MPLKSIAGSGPASWFRLKSRYLSAHNADNSGGRSPTMFAASISLQEGCGREEEGRAGTGQHHAGDEQGRRGGSKTHIRSMVVPSILQVYA